MTDLQPAISFEGPQLCSWFESLDGMLIQPDSASVSDDREGLLRPTLRRPSENSIRQQFGLM